MKEKLNREVGSNIELLESITKTDSYVCVAEEKYPQTIITEIEEDINLINCMSFDTLIGFIADIYCKYITDFLESDLKCKTSKSNCKNYLEILENAIWCLDEYETFEYDLDMVSETIRENHHVELTDEDRMFLRVMNYTGKRNEIEYYIEKAKAYTRTYHVVITQEKVLKEEIKMLAKLHNDAERVVIIGSDYQDLDPKEFKPDNPYKDAVLKDAWEIGWSLGKINELWRSVLGR